MSKSNTNGNSNSVETECGVCYNAFDPSTRPKVPFEHCCHSVCSECYQKLLESAGGDRCPFCRVNMDGSEEVRNLQTDERNQLHTIIDIFGRRITNSQEFLVRAPRLTALIVSRVAERAGLSFANPYELDPNNINNDSTVHSDQNNNTIRTSRRLREQADRLRTSQSSTRRRLSSRPPSYSEDYDIEMVVNDNESEEDNEEHTQEPNDALSSLLFHEVSRSIARRVVNRLENSNMVDVEDSNAVGVEDSNAVGIESRRRSRRTQTPTRSNINRPSRGRRLVAHVRTNSANPIDAVDVLAMEAMNIVRSQERNNNNQ